MFALAADRQSDAALSRRPTSCAGSGSTTLEVVVRAGNDLHADDFADAAAGGGAGVGGGLHGGHVAGHERA